MSNVRFKMPPKTPSLLPKNLQGSSSAPVAQSRRNADEKDDKKSKLQNDRDDTISSSLQTPVPSSQPVSISLDEARTMLGRGDYSSARKHFQVIQPSTSCGNAAGTTAYVISAITQGSAIDNRQGLRCRWKHLTVRGQVNWLNNFVNPGTNIGILFRPVPVRIFVFLDKIPPAGATILATNATPSTNQTAMLQTLGGGAGYNTVAPYNVNSHGVRYKIYADIRLLPKSQIVAGNATSVAASGSETWEVSVPLDEEAVYFSGTGTDCTVNQLEVLICCDTPDATWQTAPTFSFATDLSYYDMNDV